MKSRKEELLATQVSKICSKTSERYLMESSDFRVGLHDTLTSNTLRKSKSPLKIKTTVNQTYLYDIAKFKNSNEMHDHKK